MDDISNNLEELGERNWKRNSENSQEWSTIGGNHRICSFPAFLNSSRGCGIASHSTKLKARFSHPNRGHGLYGLFEVTGHVIKYVWCQYESYT